VPDGMVTVIDRAGNKSTLSKDWTGLGLAWAPSGREVWFTATRGSTAPSIQAVSLGGNVRPIHAAPDWLVLHDIAPDGQLLVSRNSIKQTLMCQGPGESAERELTWLGGTGNPRLSADGRMVVFQEGLSGRQQRLPTVFQRDISGTPAVRLGEGNMQSLSPDGRWVLVFDVAATLVPTGAGSPKALDAGEIGRLLSGLWFPDSKRIALGARSRGANTRVRIWVQDVDGGPPRPITPETVSTFPLIVTPDGKAVVGIAFGETEAKLYPLDGGAPTPFPRLREADTPIAWSADGTTLFAMVPAGGPWVSARTVVRIDAATGSRSVWKTLGPSDRIGVDSVSPVTMTPDGRAYCYSYMRRLGSLFTVDGLR
jgi:eukaryotic-like serine/threonine-protein kinase